MTVIHKSIETILRINGDKIVGDRAKALERFVYARRGQLSRCVTSHWSFESDYEKDVIGYDISKFLPELFRQG